jgi:hypothetical protein
VAETLQLFTSMTRIRIFHIASLLFFGMATSLASGIGPIIIPAASPHATGEPKPENRPRETSDSNSSPKEEDAKKQNELSDAVKRNLVSNESFSKFLKTKDGEKVQDILKNKDVSKAAAELAKLLGVEKGDEVVANLMVRNSFATNPKGAEAAYQALENGKSPFERNSRLGANWEKAMIAEASRLYQKHQALTQALTDRAGFISGPTAIRLERWERALKSGTDEEKNAAARDMATLLRSVPNRKGFRQFLQDPKNGITPAIAQKLSVGINYTMGLNAEGQPLPPRFKSTDPFRDQWTNVEAPAIARYQMLRAQASRVETVNGKSVPTAAALAAMKQIRTDFKEQVNANWAMATGDQVALLAAGYSDKPTPSWKIESQSDLVRNIPAGKFKISASDANTLRTRFAEFNVVQVNKPLNFDAFNEFLRNQTIEAAYQDVLERNGTKDDAEMRGNLEYLVRDNWKADSINLGPTPRELPSYVTAPYLRSK